MFRNRLYYFLKPLIPWSVRMAVRRWFAVRKRARVKETWPILSGSEKAPVDWPGWPDGKQFAFVLTHDVEGPAGLRKIRPLIELERSLGFRSSFNLIPEGSYKVTPELRDEIAAAGFEVGVHDLFHDGRLFLSRREFSRRAPRINQYIREWGVAGFRSGFMLRNLDWLHDLDVQYDASTFDTDPFEPQPSGQHTIFPFWVPRSAVSGQRSEISGQKSGVRDQSALLPSTAPDLISDLRPPISDAPAYRRTGYVELPYTLPQDSTLFLILRETSPEIWIRKLDWIAKHGGMVLVNVHPDYLQFNGEPASPAAFSVGHYRQLLEYAIRTYGSRMWIALPHEVARWVQSFCRTEPRLSAGSDLPEPHSERRLPAGLSGGSQAAPDAPLAAPLSASDAERVVENRVRGILASDGAERGSENDVVVHPSDSGASGQSDPTPATHRSSAPPVAAASGTVGGQKIARGKIWIDLDNTPHVPFFEPIIEELERRGYSLLLTMRDAFGVIELANMRGLKCHAVGRHYGKHWLAKGCGLVFRAMQLAPLVLRERPVLAVSHGARSQLIVCNVLRIPSLLIEDYEHARFPRLMRPDWILAPDAIPEDALPQRSERVRTYHGLKEDVYVWKLKPDSHILDELGIPNGDIVVTVRPPATEAHYHNPESEVLFARFMDRASAMPGAHVVMLPRNRAQADRLIAEHPAWFAHGRVKIPEHALDGLNLLCFSDLVVSGGGTMNREAAALGVPVYSIFRGRTGAVDHELSREGRLVMLKTLDDVDRRIRFQKRVPRATQTSETRHTLSQVVDTIAEIADLHGHPPLRMVGLL